MKIKTLNSSGLQPYIDHASGTSYFMYRLCISIVANSYQSEYDWCKNTQNISKQYRF